jgi:shikimate dehydrogenase
VVAEPKARRAAVLGAPIEHSLSPALHRAGYAAAGLSDWSYEAIRVAEGELDPFVAGLDASWRGLSLTMPHKEAAFAVATEVSAVAATVRAVNTLVRRADGGWDADNTDVDGIVAALRDVDHHGHALVLGAGATARSAVLALQRLGVRRVDIAARRRDAALSALDLVTDVGLRGEPLDLAGWAAHPPSLVLSTVPASAGTALVPSTTERSGLGITLFDVVYAPWPTPLAAVVAAAGGRTVSGLEMLIHQAARQFELFTGVPADLAAMRAAVGERR